MRTSTRRHGNSATTVLLVVLLALAAAAAGAACARPAAAASLPAYLQTYQYVGQFGSPGTGAAQFEYLTQITFGPNGNIYAADKGNLRIQELTTGGAWVRTIGVASPPDWGGGSVGLGQPRGIAVSSSHVWVVDYSNGLAWFGLDGTWQGMSLGPNPPADTFGYPEGAGVDSHGNVYVADDASSYRVLKYDSAGAFVCAITSVVPMSAMGVAVDVAGKVYVADGSGYVRCFSSGNGTAYTQTAPWDMGDGSSPTSIALDRAGNVYVGDQTLSRVVKLSPQGKLLAKWGSASAGPSPGPGQYIYLWGVAVDPANGYVYVADRDADRIQSFRLLDLGPKTYAAANLKVVKGKKVTFKYGVAEDVSATAKTTIKIKKGAKVKQTVKLGLVKCGSWLTKKVTCKLAKGSYRWYVYATDPFGHAQVLVGSKSLTVK